MSNRFWPATELTDGANSLAAISAAEIADGDAAFVVRDGIVSFYRMNVSSGAAHDPPDVVAPDNVGGAAFRWIKVGAVGNEPVNIGSEDNYLVWAGLTWENRNTRVGAVANPEEWEVVSGVDLTGTGVPNGGCALIIGNNIWFIGNTGTSAQYAPLSDMSTWTAVTGLPDLRTNCFAVIGDHVWAFGGVGTSPWKEIRRAAIAGFNGSFDLLSEYGPDVNVLPNSVAYGNLFIVDEYIYLIGGVTDSFEFNLSIQKAPVADPISWEVVSGKVLPYGTYYATSASTQDHLYILGGEATNDGDTGSNKILRASVLDPTTWEEVPGKTLHTATFNAACVVTNTHMVLVGGEDNGPHGAIQVASIEDPTTWALSDKVFTSLDHKSTDIRYASFVHNNIAYIARAGTLSRTVAG